MKFSTNTLNPHYFVIRHNLSKQSSGAFLSFQVVKELVLMLNISIMSDLLFFPRFNFFLTLLFIISHYNYDSFEDSLATCRHINTPRVIMLLKI